MSAAKPVVTPTTVPYVVTLTATPTMTSITMSTIMPMTTLTTMLMAMPQGYTHHFYVAYTR
jgi:hypothetical protein